MIPLISNGVAAAMLTSAQDGYEKSKVHDMLAGGDLKLLFVAPERLAMPGFFDTLIERGLTALVIDEAHLLEDCGALETLRVKAANGVTRVAKGEDVTHVRWMVMAPVSPGASDSVTYKAVIK